MLFYWIHLAWFVFACMELPNDIGYQWNAHKLIKQSTKWFLAYLSLIPRPDFSGFPCAVPLLPFDLQSGAISYGFVLWFCWASQCQGASDGLLPLWPMISDRGLTRDTQSIKSQWLDDGKLTTNKRTLFLCQCKAVLWD